MTIATLVVRCSNHPTYSGEFEPAGRGNVVCTPCFTVRSYFVMRESVRRAQEAHNNMRVKGPDYKEKNDVT